MKMRNRNLILDFNNVLYRGVAVHPNLSHEGTFTGGLFGFVVQLASLINKYEPDTVVACTDSKPYLRAKLYPDYKKRRKEKTDPLKEARKQIARIQCESLLDLLGMPVWAVDGLEADDLMYYACEKTVGAERTVIVSNDDDLNQLFFTFGNIAMDRSGKLYTEEMFFEEFPSWSKYEYVMWLAIMGTHNGVPGIPGYGKMRARDIIGSGQLIEFSREHEDVRTFKKIIWLPYVENDSLHDLPFRAKKNVPEALRMLTGHGIKITPQISSAFRKWEAV